jgi:hypothetical protein
VSTLLGNNVGARAARARWDSRSAPRVRPPSRTSTRAPLRAVSAPAQQPHSSAFVVLMVLLLAGGMVGLLVLNTAMQRGAFALEKLRNDAETLSVRGQVLDLQVERLRSPERLARRATALGMVPVGSPVFLYLDSDSASAAGDPVWGNPAPAVAGAGPQLVPSAPSQKPSGTQQPLGPDPDRPAADQPAQGKPDQGETQQPQDTPLDNGEQAAATGQDEPAQQPAQQPEQQPEQQPAAGLPSASNGGAGAEGEGGEERQ